MRSVKTIMAAACALTLAAAAPGGSAPASAAPLILDGTTLFAFGTEGEDVFFGSTTATDLTLTLGSGFDAIPAACSGGGGTVTCSLALIDQLVILALGNDDVIQLDGIGANLSLFINAGSGDDIVVAGAGDDIVKGGAGDDTILDAGGTNQLFGGQGSDVIIGATADQDGEGPADPRPSVVTPVPEPGTALLLGLGLAAVWTRRRLST